MSKRLLIVEDDLDLGEALRIFFEKSGFEVISSSDAYGGIQLAHKERPDLLILDITMPAGGGISVLRKLKQSIHTKNIPVIITTGSASKDDEQEALRLGIKEYIRKPYSPEELLGKINKIL